MNTKIIDMNGNYKEEIELEDKVYKVNINQHIIWEAIKCELANKRQGTHNTKGRSDVRGGGRKPFRQKGTGRARAGTIRSPLYKGGGVVFGPHPRDYSYKMPKKAKRLSYRVILSQKVESGVFKVIESLKVDSGKTKEACELLSKLTNKRRVIVVYKEEDKMLKRALRNIPWVNYLSCYRLSAHNLFYAKEILITKDAALELNSFLLKGLKGADNGDES